MGCQEHSAQQRSRELPSQKKEKKNSEAEHLTLGYRSALLLFLQLSIAEPDLSSSIGCKKAEQPNYYYFLVLVQFAPKLFFC